MYRMKEYQGTYTRKIKPVLKDQCLHRCFCTRHSTRGDWGGDDLDSNYVLMEGSEQPVKVAKADVHKAESVYVYGNSVAPE